MNKLEKLYQLLDKFEDTYGFEETKRILEVNNSTVNTMSVEDLVENLEIEMSYWN